MDSRDMWFNPEKESDSQKWLVSLGERNNLLNSDIPYIPMFVENINEHCSHNDFEEKRIKTIQTIGEIVATTRDCARIKTLTPGNESEFPISFDELDDTDIYVKDDNFYRPIWEKYRTFKIYGTLKYKGTEYMIEITHLVPIKDPIGSYNILGLLSLVAPKEYRYYTSTREQDEMLEKDWEEISNEIDQISSDED
ncbi:uncharacterized protein LOC144467760 [Augochlora pura]